MVDELVKSSKRTRELKQELAATKHELNIALKAVRVRDENIDELHGAIDATLQRGQVDTYFISKREHMKIVDALEKAYQSKLDSPRIGRTSCSSCGVVLCSADNPMKQVIYKRHVWMCEKDPVASAYRKASARVLELEKGIATLYGKKE